MRYGRYIFGVALCVMLLGASASGVSRKPKSSGDNEAKTADTVKQSQTPKDSAKKAVVPALPVKKDSAVTKSVTPAKFNDFRDENKNGIDDRLEKAGTETKKPSSTATKKTETKKSEAKKTETKKTETKKSETKKSSTISKSTTTSKKSK